MNTSPRLSHPLRPAPYPCWLVRLPLLETMICGGFPSPADDHKERTIDLNEELARNEPATFLFRVVGHSGRGEYVRDGDVAVRDRSLKPRHGQVVVATVNNESCVKLFCQRGGRTWLASANPLYPDVEFGEESEVVIEGVVTWTLHRQGRAESKCMIAHVDCNSFLVPDDEERQASLFRPVDPEHAEKERRLTEAVAKLNL